MDRNELKQVIFEVIRERGSPLSSLAEKELPEKPKMEFSKKLILGASIFYVLMGIASFISWFVFGEWPYEVIEFFAWPTGAAIVSYMGKTAYENKAKIEKWKE